MRKVLFLFLLFNPVLLFAQKESGERDLMTIDLRVGSEYYANGILLKFVRVISDSRCPRQVTCIWEGEAKVLLEIAAKGECFEKEVFVTGSLAKIPLKNDLILVINQLSPYPETPEKIPSEAYRLEISASFMKED